MLQPGQWLMSGLLLGSLTTAGASLGQAAEARPGNDGLELAPSVSAAAVLTGIRERYAFVLDEPRLARLRQSDAARLVREDAAWRAVVPEALLGAAPQAAEVRIGARASEGFVITDRGSGLAVRARLVGAGPGGARREGGW